jgi:hypothetical protein
VISQWLNRHVQCVENCNHSTNLNSDWHHLVNRINWPDLFSFHHDFVSSRDQFARVPVIKLGVCSPARYLVGNRSGSVPVRQTSTTLQSISRTGRQAIAEVDEEHALGRGLLHAVLLSLGAWTALLCLALFAG